MAITNQSNPALNCIIDYDPIAGITIDTSGGAGGFQINMPYGNLQPPGTQVFDVNGVNNQSSGVNNMIVFSPTVAQTGTASYNALFLNVTETSIGSGGGNLLALQVGGVTKWSVSRTGQVTTPGTAGNAASSTNVIKSVTGIQDATATAVIAVTIPNTANAAVIDVVVVGSLGAGGAVGAFECSNTLRGAVVVTRVAGVLTVATAATAAITAAAAVAGATTETLAYAAGAVSGAVGATNTFNITITITKGGGASQNHSAIISATCVNSQAAGITIA
jgi:hypothetical protein